MNSTQWSLLTVPWVVLLIFKTLLRIVEYRSISSSFVSHCRVSRLQKYRPRHWEGTSRQCEATSRQCQVTLRQSDTTMERDTREWKGTLDNGKGHSWMERDTRQWKETLGTAELGFLTRHYRTTLRYVHTAERRSTLSSVVPNCRYLILFCCVSSLIRDGSIRWHDQFSIWCSSRKLLHESHVLILKVRKY